MITRCILALFLSAYGAFGAAMPAGIPEPPFGFPGVDDPPALPDPWTSEVPNFIYVNQDEPGNTDTGRTYGYPGAARNRIPTAIVSSNAPIVVVIGGTTYDRAHAGGGKLLLAGSGTYPIWIVGEDPDNRPTLVHEMQITGTNFGLSNVKFDLTAVSGTTERLTVVQPSYEFVIRYVDMLGHTNGSGRITLYPSNTAGVYGWNEYGLFYSNHVHGCGLMQYEGDQDSHAFSIGHGNRYMWYLMNRMETNSGDGIQITGTDNNNVNHIYVGWNYSISNKQTGFWVKNASDVIFSENIAYGHQPSASSSGAGFGAQYGPEWIWWINNKSFNNRKGFWVASDSGGGGTNHFWVGNLVWVTTTNTVNPALEAWAFGSQDVDRRYLINNTIWQSGSEAIDFYNAGFEAAILHGNIIGEPTNGAANVLLQGATTGADEFSDNLVPGNRIVWETGDPGTTWTLAQFISNTGLGDGCSTNLPTFMDADNGDFRLAQGSAGINASSEHAVYQMFEDRYGLDIRVDMNGTTRPQGSAWDIGAYEFQSGSRRATMGGGARLSNGRF